MSDVTFLCTGQNKVNKPRFFFENKAVVSIYRWKKVQNLKKEEKKEKKEKKNESRKNWSKVPLSFFLTKSPFIIFFTLPVHFCPTNLSQTFFFLSFFLSFAFLISFYFFLICTLILFNICLYISVISISNFLRIRDEILLYGMHNP